MALAYHVDGPEDNVVGRAQVAVLRAGGNVNEWREVAANLPPFTRIYAENAHGFALKNATHEATPAEPQEPTAERTQSVQPQLPPRPKKTKPEVAQQHERKSQPVGIEKEVEKTNLADKKYERKVISSIKKLESILDGQ